MNKIICGIDEAGRGPLAGPVTAAAVILPDDFEIELLNDSKKLSEKKRNALEILIKEKCIAWSVSHISHNIIDEINILNASLLAMKNAYESLVTPNGNIFSGEVNKIIVDGIYFPKLNVSEKIECVTKIKADATEPSVMAASILAKTARDKLMIEYSKIYPEYQYEKHKGYPTKLHKEICKKIGPSPIQRRTFKI
ncbi:MAG: ribonuclease HII [Spirochaetaceae bacterium]|nr:ribonuclease HII [Spirochaetaceae bacterium]